MLKSPPAHQQQTRLLGSSAVVPVDCSLNGGTSGSNERSGGGSGGEGNTRGSGGSGGSNGVIFHREDAASSCDADDEEFAGETGTCGYDDDQPLDMSVRRGKDIEVLVGVKRGRDSDSGGSSKRVRVSEGNKRKHLRKKRRDCGGSYNGGRPSVISFAGVNGDDGGSSSSSSGDEGARVFRRRRKRVWVKESELVGGFDVDEHFRRSLGAEWEAVVGKSNGGGGVGGLGVGEGERKEDVNGGGSVRVIIEDSIKPSDVDDHFAKALGSETWSKIIASATAPSSPTPSTNHIPRQLITPTNVSTPPRSPPPPLPPAISSTQTPGCPVTTPPTDLPPPTQPLPRVSSTGSSSSTISSGGGGSSYKIDAILGNTTKSNDAQRVEESPLPLVHRVRDDSEI